MSDDRRTRIIKALPEGFIRRMGNWARAQAGGSIRYAQSSVWDGGRYNAGYAEPPIPILEGEADDTDAALRTLPARYQQAVRLFWLWDLNVAVLARKSACDPKTFESRLEEGHALLRAELYRRSEQWRATRARNAAMATN